MMDLVIFASPTNVEALHYEIADFSMNFELCHIPVSRLLSRIIISGIVNADKSKLSLE